MLLLVVLWWTARFLIELGLGSILLLALMEVRVVGGWVFREPPIIERGGAPIIVRVCLSSIVLGLNFTDSLLIFLVRRFGCI